MTLPILYSFRRCPYAMRARFAIWTARVRCELREVILRDKPSSLTEYSEKGTVPVLVLADGTVIDESLEVMFWALAQDSGHNWLAAPAGCLADMRSLIAINDNEFKTHLDRYKYPERYEDPDPLHHREEGERFLLELDKRIATNGYFFGPEPKLADYAIAPFIRQFANTDRAWFDATNHSALRSWLDDLLGRPLFQSIMVKHVAWQESDMPTIIP
jgi:glutathione S-transferase